MTGDQIVNAVLMAVAGVAVIGLAYVLLVSLARVLTGWRKSDKAD